MALFKRKKKVPTLYYTLDMYLKEAKDAGKQSFYCPLLNGEETLAQAWCVINRLYMTLNHLNGNTKVYKFSGV